MQGTRSLWAPKHRAIQITKRALRSEGLGTTAAKTSFFGSLQAVVCAGRHVWLRAAVEGSAPGITCIVAGRLNMGTLAAAAMAVTGSSNIFDRSGF